MEVCSVSIERSGDVHSLPIAELDTAVLHNVMEFLDISFSYLSSYLISSIC